MKRAKILTSNEDRKIDSLYFKSHIVIKNAFNISKIKKNVKIIPASKSNSPKRLKNYNLSIFSSAIFEYRSHNNIQKIASQQDALTFSHCNTRGDFYGHA